VIVADADLTALPADLLTLLERVVREAEAHPEFAAALAARFGKPERGSRSRQSPGARPRPKHRRTQGVLDPFAVVTAGAGGEAALREQLSALRVEQLKDIIAEHAMDTTKLAMKWKTSDRLIDLIVTTVRSRLAKGSAFRQP
jgi:chemotaxis response regulator CheB